MFTTLTRSMLALALASVVASAHAELLVTVGVAPPMLPVYAQPPIPGDGYLWTPGYWAWDSNLGDYTWIPGAWTLPPYVGALWTPGYWGWGGGYYHWHHGYWGREVGYYGGVNYGYGYIGVGYVGGYWGHNGFNYNRSVNNISYNHITNITNVYNAPLPHNTGLANVNRVSYSGGPGGLNVRPTPQQMRVSEQHFSNSMPAQHFAATGQGLSTQRDAYGRPFGGSNSTSPSFNSNSNSYGVGNHPNMRTVNQGGNPSTYANNRVQSPSSYNVSHSYSPDLRQPTTPNSVRAGSMGNQANSGNYYNGNVSQNSYRPQAIQPPVRTTYSRPDTGNWQSSRPVPSYNPVHNAPSGAYSPSPRMSGAYQSYSVHPGNSVSHSYNSGGSARGHAGGGYSGHH